MGNFPPSSISNLIRVYRFHFAVYTQVIVKTHGPLFLSSIVFLPASPKAKAGLGVQSLRPSVRLSVPKSCHRNSSETTDPIFMKLGM